MTAFSQWIDTSSVSVLFIAINVAVAATIIAALALVNSRIRVISLPVRHAICICAVVGTIVTPLLVVSLERLAPRFAEISVNDWPARTRTNSELVAARQPLTQDVTFAPIALEDHATESIDGVNVKSRPASTSDPVTAKPEISTIATPQEIADSSADIGHQRTHYGLMLGKLLMLVWFIGSVVYLIRRVRAEIRLQEWLMTCSPIADVETMHAAQSAAFFVGLNEEAPLRRLAVQFRLRRWSKRRSRIADAETLEAVQSAATAVELDERPVLLRSNTLPAPVVCGLLHPRLVLPASMVNGSDRLSHDQRTAVLAHEMAHLARRDLVTGLCLTIAGIAYWWNPLVRMLCSRTEDLAEQICDDFATSSLKRPREYAAALLHFSERSTDGTPQAASLGLSISTVSQLEIRVRRVLHSTQSKPLRVSATACVVVVLMSTVLAAAASMMQIRAVVDELPATDSNVAQTPQPRPTVEHKEPNAESARDAELAAAQQGDSKTPAAPEDRELLITVFNAKEEPIVGATVRISAAAYDLESLTTNDLGQVTSKKCGTEGVSIQMEAPGFRPTTMDVGNVPPTLRIMMMPKTELAVIDEDGKPQGSIFVGRERFARMNLDFDRNGFPIGPNLDFGRDPKEDRTDENGSFRLVNDITLRTLENPVPIWAVSDNGDRFGWMWVPPAELDQPQTLVLKKTAFVEAAFMIKPQTRENMYSWSLLDNSGFRIASVAPNVSPFGVKEFCSLRFRVPPGDYFLCREVPNGNPATSVLGFTIEPDRTHVDLGLVEELSDAIDIDSEWGSVHGRIQVTNPDHIDLRPEVILRAGRPANIWANIVSEDLLVDPQSGGLEGVFVYLAKAPALIHPEAGIVPNSSLMFDQVAGRFSPHLMIVRVGQSVECMNTSTIAMSVHNFPLKNQAVNMMIRPLTKPNAGILWTPKREESLPMKVASDLHPWMAAYWLALDHPYAAITNQQGRFVIENLPPGKHIVEIWHERVGFIERKLEVTIEPGQITAQPTITVEAASLMGQKAKR